MGFSKENVLNVVLMRAYNAGDSIRSSMQGAYDTFGGDVCFFVVNDGSIDNTWDEIMQFSREHPTTVHAYDYPHEGGASAVKKVMFHALDFGMNLPAGTPVAFSTLDADDQITSGAVVASKKIGKICEELGEDPGIVCYLPFKRTGYLPNGDDAEYYNLAAYRLSRTCQSFDTLSPADQTTFVERVPLAYQFKTISLKALFNYVTTVMPYYPNDGKIAIDMPSIIMPFYPKTLMTGVTEIGSVYHKSSKSVTGSQYSDPLPVVKEKVAHKIYFAQLARKVARIHPTLFSPSAIQALDAFEARMHEFITRRTEEIYPGLGGFVETLWDKMKKEPLPVDPSTPVSNRLFLSSQPAEKKPPVSIAYNLKGI